MIRSNGEVRCYYPDAKVVRVEPRTFRNAFPSLSPQQQSSLAQYYTVRKGGIGRVAGLEAQAWTFEPKDGLRYGHELWTDPTTGILLKARMINERGEVVFGTSPKDWVKIMTVIVLGLVVVAAIAALLGYLNR